ncbi:MAG: hypothetical protein AAFP77_15695 [Bacteroidota bacterium]
MPLLLNVDGIFPIVVVAYLVLHSPAFILLGISAWIKETKPQASKVLKIIAIVYFVVGTGICGALLTG